MLFYYMDIFRPTNSSESNLFTIRFSVGLGSELGVFNTSVNTLSENDILISNNPTQIVTKDYLTSPSRSNLPNNFFLKYVTNSQFMVTYGKDFTQQPCVTITPHLTPVLEDPAATTTNPITLQNLVIPVITKNNLNGNDNLTINFLQNDGNSALPSSDGQVGLLGFDVVITGPVKLGITTGNSNKGWAINSSPEGSYSYLDLNLGSGNIISNSVVISKNLKLLGSNGNIKKFDSSIDVVDSDYINTVWELNNGIDIRNITPQKGMILIIYRNSPTDTTITLTDGCTFDFGTSNICSFNSNAASVTLYGTSNTNFVVLNMKGTVSLLNLVI